MSQSHHDQRPFHIVFVNIYLERWSVSSKDTGQKHHSLTVTHYMSAHLCQGMAYIHVGAQQIVVFGSVPFLEGGKLLRNRGEETNNDTHRCGLHVVAELADNLLILLIIRVVTNGHEPYLQESDSGSQIASPPTQQARSRQP